MDNKQTQNELKDYNKLFIESEVKQMKSMIDEISDLVEDIDSKVSILPEEIFVSRYLQYFKTIKSKNHDDPLLIEWVTFAGSYYSPVDLINRQGDIVIRVPPLMARHSIDLGALDDVDFQYMGNQYMKLIDSPNPIQGSNYLANELSSLPKCIDGNVATTEAEGWKAVFARYSSTSSTNTETVASKKIKDNLGISYDD